MVKIENCKECNAYGKVVGQGLCSKCYQRKRQTEQKMKLNYNEANKQDSYLTAIKNAFSPKEEPLSPKEELLTDIKPALDRNDQLAVNVDGQKLFVKYGKKEKRYRPTLNQCFKLDLKVLGAMCVLNEPIHVELAKKLNVGYGMLISPIRRLRLSKIIRVSGRKETNRKANVLEFYDTNNNFYAKVEKHFKEMTNNRNRMHLQQILDYVQSNRGEPRNEKVTVSMKATVGKKPIVKVVKSQSNIFSGIRGMLNEVETENAMLRQENARLQKELGEVKIWKEKVKSLIR